MTYTEEVFEYLGFHVPTARYRKVDPRGHEYGYFTVEEMAKHYAVQKFSACNDFQWECRFTNTEDLRAWAQECT